MTRCFPGIALAACAALAAGCAGLAVGPRPGEEPVRVSDIVRLGDPQRRASMRMVDSGLDADAAGVPGRARIDYERALTVDPTNPFAYLALARHHADAGEPGRALEYLGRAEALLGSEALESPRVAAHLDGLRGWALVGMGRAREGRALLQRAGDLAPSVWGDGRLDARELR